MSVSNQPIQSLPGFRDFYPAACASRNYAFQIWRTVALRYGFNEWEGPMLESTELYQRKSGAEITQQLFNFTDKGEREVSLRPELTPTLARLVAAGHRDYKKPIKWFQIGQCFRYEAPQKGRLREFIQWNCDLIGEPSVEADAELIAMGIDVLRAFGFTAEDVAVRVSDRRLWNNFATRAGIADERLGEFLSVIDRMERERPEKTEELLQALGTSRTAVDGYIQGLKEDPAPFAPLLASLKARGMAEFVRVDPSIVRGLAYYTGVVFEFFALKQGMRAVAGGGRYDGLISLMSSGKVDLPAVGFAMGDVVLGDLISATPAAEAKRAEWIAQTSALDAYLVVADEAFRPQAIQVMQTLRDAGLRADISLSAAKVGKQFQSAEGLAARTAIVVGSEWPQVKIKTLATREEAECAAENVLSLVLAR